jgi:RND family efflux transporter MFP subunit
MEVMVERGAVVRAGQALMRLRDVDYRTSLTLAQASLAQARARLGLMAGAGAFDAEAAPEVRAARANLDLAEDALRRAQQLAQTGSTSDQDLRRATSQAAAAREQYQGALNNMRAAYYALQSARAATEQARRNVTDAIVRAPFDGEIAERRANVGEYVTPQRAVVTLVRTSPLRLELQIPQDRIPYVQRGQTVDVAVDAFPNRPLHGTIRYLSAAVRSDNRSLVAEAVVPNEDGTLRPGLFVTARIRLGRTQNAVAVPRDSVLRESGSNRVFVVAHGRVQERVVTVADRGATEWLVTQGVEAGETVATEHLDRLADGARVETRP